MRVLYCYLSLSLLFVFPLLLIYPLPNSSFVSFISTLVQYCTWVLPLIHFNVIVHRLWKPFYLTQPSFLSFKVYFPANIKSEGYLSLCCLPLNDHSKLCSPKMQGKYTITSKLRISNATLPNVNNLRDSYKPTHYAGKV